jgi:hypothetical protein
MAAVVYRHWLQMRTRLMIAGLALALLSVVYLLALSIATWPEQPGPAGALVTAHIWLSGMTALFAGLLLGGTGIRADDLERGRPSLYYTLTLPVSRFAWIGTRMAVAYAATVALFTGMLVVQSVALLVIDQPVSLGTMAASSALAGLLALAMQAVLGLLLPLWDERLGLIASVAVFVAAVMSISAGFNDNIDAWSYGWTPAALTFMAGQPVQWSAVWVLALIVAASVSLAALIARRKDF